MKPLPTALLIGSLAVLVFTFILPTSSSNQLAAIASSPSITFKQNSLSVTEGDRLKVVIVAPSTLTSTTRVKVTTKSGTAKSGTDFSPLSTYVTFYKGGLKEKTVTLVTKSDSVQEQAETLSLSLTVGNKVTNTTTVTLNNKGTTSTTPGSTLPASANQGNTLGGNPSFTTYSPQGLPQPMNSKCKPVPSKYTFEQNKFPPNNPSNPFYTWEDVYGATFPLFKPEGYFTFTIKAFGYVSYQFQVPPLESPLSSVTPGHLDVVHYPAGSHASGILFVSECPWQDYYADVIAFHGGTSPIVQEFNNAIATQGVQILSQQTFLQGDLYKRWTAEKNRIADLTAASGQCNELTSFSEDDLLNITYNKDYFEASFNTIQTGANNPPRSWFCYVKPGGTYYMTMVSHNNDMQGQAANSTSPQRTYKIFPRVINHNDIFTLPYGFSDNSAIGARWTKPLAERLAVKEKVLSKRAENIMIHPDIGRYNIAFSSYSPVMQIQFPTLKSRKLCLLGDQVRADCWMGKFGLGIEGETDEARQEATKFKWRNYGNPAPGAANLACPAGTTADSPCNSPERYDTTCNNSNGGTYTCLQGSQGLAGDSGFGPN